MPNVSISSSFEGVNAIKFLIMHFPPVSSIIHNGPEHPSQHLVLQNLQPYMTCPTQFQSFLTWFNLPNSMLTLQSQSDIEGSYFQPF
jgi:hypothetical protein